MQAIKNHWKKLLLLVLLLVIAFWLWPRPLCSFERDDVTIITIVTTDFGMDTSATVNKPTIDKTFYKFDTEEEINMVLDVLDQYSFHYTPKQFTDAFLSAVFAADYQHGYHGDPSLPELFDIEIYDNTGYKIYYSTWGDGYLQNHANAYLRMGYFSKGKSVSFFKDVMKLCSEEYKMKITSKEEKEDGSIITSWE